MVYHDLPVLFVLLFCLSNGSFINTALSDFALLFYVEVYRKNGFSLLINILFIKENVMKMLIVVFLFVSNVAFANGSDGFFDGSLKEISLTEKNKSRANAGITPFYGSATDITVLFADGAWDFSIWGTFENSNDLVLNEGDIDFGYTAALNDSWSVRLGVAECIFPEGKNHHILKKDLSYSGYINVNLSTIYSLTDSGMQHSLTLSSNPIPMGSFVGGSFSFVPSAKAVCLDEFFGLSGCFSNLTYQGLVSGTWGNEWGVDFFLNYQDGRDYGAEKDFDNAWVFGAKLRFFF